jgi:hypothetical protein
MRNHDRFYDFMFYIFHSETYIIHLFIKSLIVFKKLKNNDTIYY